jgi:glutamyl-Q tRNA(Asp) synthetase
VSYRGRFAPSPTGPLHFGSLVAALASWLDARSQGGAWLVRMEDVDETRTAPGAADAILRALETFGLEWDGEVLWQSRRKERYEAALASLRAHQLVYACRCSRKEIADSGLRGIEGAIYPGTCRAIAIGESDPAIRIGGADSPIALRMRVPDEPIAFDDRVQGRIAQNLARDIGDFILRRRDGLFAYQLAVVVDDGDQRITDVVRGADLLTSTPRQILLQRALGLPTPRYLHFPVAINARGEKLSKQTLAAAIEPANAAPLLAAALDFLGQSEAEGSTPREILARAASAWDAARIPRRPEAPVTRSDGEVTGGGV